MPLPEPLNRYFAVLIEKPFNREQLIVSWDPEFPNFPTAYKQWEDYFWETSQHQNSTTHLFDEVLCQLRDYNYEEPYLHLSLGPIQFRSHYFYLKKSKALNLPFTILPLGLGVSAVVLSQDEQVLFMKRSQNVASYKGSFDVFGGHIPCMEDQDDRAPDPFLAIQTELTEEIGLPPENILQLNGLGLIRNQQTKQLELVFLCRTELSAKAVIARAQKAKDQAEYSHIIQIPNRSDRIQFICQKYAEDFSPSGLGSLWLYATHAAQSV